MGEGDDIQPCSVLFLASNPSSTGHLALDEEARDIEAKLRAAEHREHLQLRTRWAVRVDDLFQALNEVRPTIVHFSGHGGGATGIALHDGAGGHKLVKTEALRRVFAALKDDIRVVVLNACYSDAQAEAIAEIVDCVVGMSDAVDDETARTFAASFYRALAFGRNVDNAFQQGVAAVAAHDLPGEQVPVLRARTGVDPREVFVLSRP